MIEIIPFENKKVIAMKISGKIQAESIEKITKAIDEKLKTFEKLNVYVEFEDVLKFSNDAFIKDLKFTFSHLGDFEKEAIVSNKQWLASLIKITDKLYPSIEVRHFSKEETGEARKWIQQ